jgi:hypothetical protein
MGTVAGTVRHEYDMDIFLYLWVLSIPYPLVMSRARVWHFPRGYTHNLSICTNLGI